MCGLYYQSFFCSSSRPIIHHENIFIIDLIKIKEKMWIGQKSSRQRIGSTSARAANVETCEMMIFSVINYWMRGSKQSAFIISLLIFHSRIFQFASWSIIDMEYFFSFIALEEFSLTQVRLQAHTTCGRCWRENRSDAMAFNKSHRFGTMWQAEWISGV